MSRGAEGLIDDQSTPIRWKAATVITGIGLIISVSVLVASTGAKSERLEQATEDIKALKLLPSRVDKIEVREEEINRRLTVIESNSTEILRELRRR